MIRNGTRLLALLAMVLVTLAVSAAPATDTPAGSGTDQNTPAIRPAQENATGPALQTDRIEQRRLGKGRRNKRAQGMPGKGWQPQRNVDIRIIKKGPAARGNPIQGMLGVFVLMDRLELSDPQVARLRAAFRQFRQEMAAIRGEQKKAQKEFRQRLTGKDDPKTAAEQARQLGRLAERRAMALVNAISEARGALNPQQWQKIFALFKRARRQMNQGPLGMGPRKAPPPPMMGGHPGMAMPPRPGMPGFPPPGMQPGCPMPGCPAHGIGRRGHPRASESTDPFDQFYRGRYSPRQAPPDAPPPPPPPPANDAGVPGVPDLPPGE